MGVWYKIVNIDKQQRLDLEVFGDHYKVSFASTNLPNLHLLALKWLTIPEFWSRSAPYNLEYRGLWSGDRVYTISDHDEANDEEGKEILERCRSAKDISKAVFAELISNEDTFHTRVMEILQAKSWRYTKLLDTIQSLEVGQLDDSLRTELATHLIDYYRESIINQQNNTPR